MKFSLKYNRLRNFQRWSNLIILLVFITVVLLGTFTWLVQASGSRSLYPNGATGFRANLEWRTSTYGGFLLRRTLLKVYAEQGEFILMGSSAISVTAAGGIGDVQIYQPGRVTGNVGNETIPPGPDFSCEAQRGTVPNPDLGRIENRNEELAGPDTIADAINGTPGGAVPNGYTPCFYQAPVTGIYDVIFHGPRGGNSDFEIAPTGQINLASANNFNDQQATSVSAWDVTVRNSLNSTSDVTGRVFARYLALFAGGNPRPLNSTLYILTTDGYIYQVGLRGLDPNGFIVFANNVGFFDSDGVTPLYRDVVGSDNQLTTLQGGVSLAPPTHFIFFEPPSNGAIGANNVPLTPAAPQISGLDFGGTLGNNDTLLGVGGTFTYTSNVAGTFEFIISRDGVDFDPTNPANRVLRGIRPAGTQTVAWDGLDNSGNPFPIGTNYPVRAIIRAGEYHFPMLDVENSQQGGPQYTLINPPGGTCPSFDGQPANCNIAFYDDRGYTTANGTDVGTPGVILAGNSPPNPDRSDPLSGFDTTTNQRAFGNGGTTGFGDRKGLDLWTYFPSNIENTVVNIYALNLVLTKASGGGTLQPGGIITYTLTFTNTGPIDATGVVITDVVPQHTTFNPAASSPGWNFTGVTPGSIITRSVGLVQGNSVANPPVTLVLNIDANLPQGVTQINNTAQIADDGANGPEPTFDNSDSAQVQLNVPPPPGPPPVNPPSTSSGGDDDDDDDDVPPPPPPAPAPVTVPTTEPQPTSELPVLFLPETGLREGPSEIGLFGGVLVTLAAIGIGLVAFRVWAKSNKDD